jgi:hypothetical protein
VKPRGAIQLAVTLSARLSDALLYRTLATLIDTIPLEFSLNDLKFNGVPRERFEHWCREPGVNRLKTVPEQWQ